jgi:hypothetical protein
MNREGFGRLVAIGSLDAQLEPSQLFRALGSLDPFLHSLLVRLLLELPGAQPRLHLASAYQRLLASFGLDTRPEAHLEMVPWEVLALTNLRFFLSERKQNITRLVGSLLYTTTTTPIAYVPFELVAQELGVPPSDYAYWTARMKTDALQRRWLLEEVAVPLAEHRPENAWQLLWGYDQQALASERANQALAGAARAAQQVAEATSAPTMCAALEPARLPDPSLVLPAAAGVPVAG